MIWIYISNLKLEYQFTISISISISKFYLDFWYRF